VHVGFGGQGSCGPTWRGGGGAERGAYFYSKLYLDAAEVDDAVGQKAAQSVRQTASTKRVEPGRQNKQRVGPKYPKQIRAPHVIIDEPRNFPYHQRLEVQHLWLLDQGAKSPRHLDRYGGQSAASHFAELTLIQLRERVDRRQPAERIGSEGCPQPIGSADLNRAIHAGRHMS
jgi:hypothetical protein